MLNNSKTKPNKKTRALSLSLSKPRFRQQNDVGMPRSSKVGVRKQIKNSVKFRMIPFQTLPMPKTFSIIMTDMNCAPIGHVELQTSNLQVEVRSLHWCSTQFFLGRFVSQNIGFTFESENWNSSPSLLHPRIKQRI